MDLGGEPDEGLCYVITCWRISLGKGERRGGWEGGGWGEGEAKRGHRSKLIFLVGSPSYNKLNTSVVVEPSRPKSLLQAPVNLC